MDSVFPASREERCPRRDCGSPHVEPLEAEAEFARLPVKASGHTLWLCATCQRPFKVVRDPEGA